MSFTSIPGCMICFRALEIRTDYSNISAYLKDMHCCGVYLEIKTSNMSITWRFMDMFSVYGSGVDTKGETIRVLSQMAGES